jgi:lipoate-protein ligase A
MESFLATFRGRYTVVDGELSEAEMAQAEELVRTKFANPDWTVRVP